MQLLVLLQHTHGSGLDYKYYKIIEKSINRKSDSIQKENICSTEIYIEKMQINFEKIYDLCEGEYYIILYCSDFNIRIDFSIINDELFYDSPSINKYTKPNTSHFYISENDN